MKFKFKSLVVASAFVAAGAAHAAETLTLQTGASITSQGYTVSGLSGVGALAFSGSTGISDPAGGNLIDALNLGAALVTPEAPANVTIVGGVSTYTDITAGAPIQSVTGSFDGTTLNVLRVGTLGGATQTLNADNPDVSTGGFVTIKNLQVDLVNNDIYADVIGGNGVGLVSGLKLWHVGSVTGPTSFTAAEVLAAGGTITVKNTLSNLTIYDDAFNVFTKATGLVDVLGIPALKTVNDSQFGYGTITSSITVSVKAATAAVPEPSTYALMGLGLVGMAFLRRRAAK